MAKNRRIDSAEVTHIAGVGYCIVRDVSYEYRFRSQSGRWKQHYWLGEPFVSREDAQRKLDELQGTKEAGK
jgi:hypothetical protein